VAAAVDVVVLSSGATIVCWLERFSCFCCFWRRLKKVGGPPERELPDFFCLSWQLAAWMVLQNSPLAVRSLPNQWDLSPLMAWLSGQWGHPEREREPSWPQGAKVWAAGLPLYRNRKARGSNSCPGWDHRGWPSSAWLWTQFGARGDWNRGLDRGNNVLAVRKTILCRCRKRSPGSHWH